MAMQTAPSGCFRPVGTESFGKVRQPPEAFDQQPVEALARDFRLPRGGARRGRRRVAGGRGAPSPGSSAKTI